MRIWPEPLRARVTLIHLAISMVAVVAFLFRDRLRVGEPGPFWILLLIVMLAPTDLVLFIVHDEPNSALGEVAFWGA